MMNVYASHDPTRKQANPPTTRLFKVGSCAILLCLSIACCNSGSDFIRRLCTDTYFSDDGDGPPIGVWTEAYTTSTVDYYQRATQAEDVTFPDNHVLFIVAMLECPDLAHQGVQEDTPPAEMFYDVMSILKYCGCENMTVVVNGVTTTYTTSMQVMLPGDAAECMGPNGEPYDRVKVLEQLGIGVKILGAPVEKEDVSSVFLKENVDNDVGIKDLIKLRAFNETDHSVVILVDYTFLNMQPLDNIVETFLNSDASVAFSEDYTPQGVVPTHLNNGVNTGFVLIKPSTQEFDAIVDEYKTTEYDPTTGWSGSGIGGFPGAMGTAGILKHYYGSKTPGPMVLDKCLYNNDFEYHLDSNGACRDGHSHCPDCQSVPADQVVVAKLNDKVCGKPFNCPDISVLKGTACEKFHEKWFNNRADYEEKHFKSSRKAKKAGNYEEDTTHGYCSQPGAGGYEKLIPDSESGPLPIPEPETIPPQQGCPNTCSPGKYLTQDCQCTSDECDACPEGTRCQKAENGFPGLCIDCECGFCDFAGNACCDFNGVNNCKSATNKKECLLQNSYYPGWPGTGNACSGVEISATAVPNGCGCQPNELTPCTYDANAGGDDKCFIVTAHEILESHPVKTAVADACKSCLDTCNACVSGDGQDGVNEMMNCLGKTIGKKREACRSGCANVCKH